MTCFSFACAQSKEGEISSDRFGSFEFKPSTTLLSVEGGKNLKRFAESYLKNTTTVCTIYLRGLVTYPELGTDAFLGVKRCKVVMDSLILRYGLNPEIIFITNEQIQNQQMEIGVGFILSDRKDILLESKNEDEYFQLAPKKKKKTKNE